MARGRRRKNELNERHPYYPPPPVMLSEDEQKADLLLGVWLEAARLRRVANRALQESGVSFARWRVLQAIERLVREMGDAVSQRDVAERIEMDVNTLCRIMRRLAKDELVDCGFDAWGFSHRIFLTRAGHDALAAGRRDFVRVATHLLEAVDSQQPLEGVVPQQSRQGVDSQSTLEGVESQQPREAGVRRQPLEGVDSQSALECVESEAREGEANPLGVCAARSVAVPA